MQIHDIKPRQKEKQAPFFDTTTILVLLGTLAMVLMTRLIDLMIIL